MENSEILEQIQRLPVIPTEKVAADDEIWEGSDGGARFSITRHQVPGFKREFYTLTVAGAPAERDRLIKEFSRALGQPDDQSLAPMTADHVDTVGWLIK